MIKFCRKLGVSEPAQAFEEIPQLLDGAKAGVNDHGAARRRAPFTPLAKTLLKACMSNR